MALDGRAPVLRRWYPSTGGTWDAETAWPEIVLIAAGPDRPLRAALDQPPQTNEVGRSAVLIGGLLRIDREFDLPIRLFEIGSSAGLNLRADCYHYRYAGGKWGPADSPVAIDDAWHGNLPPEGAVRIVERHGYDIAPIDVTGADGEMTVLSYVWPDQSARLERLRGAIAVARNVPARLRTPDGCRRGGRPDPGRRRVDRAVAFDHLAVSVRRRTGRDPRTGSTRWPRKPMPARRSRTSPSSPRATGPALRSSSWCAPAAGRVASCRSWANAIRTGRR